MPFHSYFPTFFCFLTLFFLSFHSILFNDTCCTMLKRHDQSTYPVFCPILKVKIFSISLLIIIAIGGFFVRVFQLLEEFLFLLCWLVLVRKRSWTLSNLFSSFETDLLFANLINFHILLIILATKDPLRRLRTIYQEGKYTNWALSVKIGFSFLTFQIDKKCTFQ